MQEQAELQDIKINSKIIDLKVLNNTFLCFKSSDNHECKSTTGFKLCKYYSYDKFCISFMNKIITDKQIHNIFTNLINKIYKVINRFFTNENLIFFSLDF